MTFEQLKQKFIDSPYLLEMGAGKLSAQFGVTRDDIYKAKAEVRSEQNRYQSQPIFHKLEEILNTPKYTGSERTSESEVKKFESGKPLSPKEIEELAGVDNINTYVARVWEKLQTNGVWTYSIDIRYRTKDFYSKDELKEKLKELMPDVKPFPLPLVADVQDKALLIVLADEHVGAINTTNLFGSEGLSYSEKLSAILTEVRLLNSNFEEVHIISLGDQLNGWNSQTTRGGHEVKSLSNKEQFDGYVKARVKFYDQLFSSGISENYFVHDVENSNHSGSGFSYMANQALNMYLEAKFPQVLQMSINDALDGFEYGNHLILMGHGKDEKYQKKPMPAVLDAKTDLFLYDFLQSRAYSPYEKHVTFYKGDLHQHGLQIGRFGRYVNVQSVIGNSDYGDINYGNTKSGALLEIIDKHSYRVRSQPIWF